DKYDRLGADGVRALVGPGRKDESGDYTRGAGLAQEQVDQIMYMFAPPPTGGLNVSHNVGIINAARDRFPNCSIYQHGWDELQRIAELTLAADNFGQVRVDPSVVRGLEYYTGPVFEADLTFATNDDQGRPMPFGSVGAGGRYEGLIARFRGEPVPATGFSIGVSRLVAALQHLGKIETKSEPGPVVVTVFEKERIGDYQQMVAALRNAGIRAELYLGSGKMGPQLKYADKPGAPCVV